MATERFRFRLLGQGPRNPWETLGNSGKPREIPLFHGPKGGRVDECQGAGLSCTLFEQVFE